AARQKVGAQQKRVDTLLVDLERDKKEMYDMRLSLQRERKLLDALKEENQTLQQYLAENKKNILKQAKSEAQEIIRNANKLVENTISGIRESGADKEKTRTLRRQLQQELDKHTVKKDSSPAAGSIVQAIAVGDWVRIADTGATAQVLEISKDNAILAMGELRTVVKKQRLEKVATKDVPKQVRKSAAGLNAESLASFYPEVDVRGLRTEAALHEIEKYLDKAIMMGFPNLKIIHGKGDGILRKMIREY